MMLWLTCCLHRVQPAVHLLEQSMPQIAALGSCHVAQQRIKRGCSYRRDGCRKDVS